MPITELQVMGTISFIGVAGLIALYFFLKQWMEASGEDAAWRSALRELGPGAIEIAGLDTRLLRPWGESAAVERFVMRARELGRGWLEAAMTDLQPEIPLSIRAVAGSIDGTEVAFVVARTRRLGLVARLVVLGPAGPVVELAPEVAAPPPSFKQDLLEVVRRAKVPA
jgi:hypothetical protein